MAMSSTIDMHMLVEEDMREKSPQDQRKTEMGKTSSETITTGRLGAHAPHNTSFYS